MGAEGYLKGKFPSADRASGDSSSHPAWRQDHRGHCVLPPWTITTLVEILYSVYLDKSA